MAQGLVARYCRADVTPPLLLYTDRDCCGTGQIGMKLFPEWPQMQVLPFTIDIVLRMRSFSNYLHPLTYKWNGVFVGQFLTRWNIFPNLSI